MDLIVNAVFNCIVEKVNLHRSLDESTNKLKRECEELNLNKLKRKCEELNCRKEDIEVKMKTDLRPGTGKILKKEVQLWLDNVGRINDEKQCIENEVGDTNFFESASLGEQVAEMIQEVEKLHQKGSFPNGLVLDKPPRIGRLFPPKTLASDTIVKRIKACLMNGDVRKIGVYGIAGIGKTTIMQHINNCIFLKEIDKFDVVIWITMSKVSNVMELQNDIASALNTDISDYEDEMTRAAKLYSILREKQRYLLVLDDITKPFRLEVVGIPEPTVANGCKIVLTTRSHDVCRCMDCKGIEMELLSKDEAWNLFLDVVRRPVLSTPSLEALAKIVAEECDCLPLAITTVARSMRNAVDDFQWRNAINQLRIFKREFIDMKKGIEHWRSDYII